MKIKWILLLVIIFSVLCSLNFECKAVNIDGYEDITESLSSDFFSSLDKDIKDALESIGISDFDYTQIYNVSLKSFAEYFKITLPEKLNSCLSDFFSLLSVVMIVSLVSTFFQNTEQGSFFRILSVVCVTVMTVNKMNVSVNSLLSAIRLGGNFMLSFVPVLTLIVSFSGNPTAAFTYNSFIMAFTQGISLFINYFAIDLIGCFFCTCICINMNDTMNTNRFLNTVNKSTAFILGITASIFTGFLSVRNVLAANVDSVAVKGIRYAISSLVPILGSSISEAYSAVIGSINLIKSSVAAIGIIAVILINVPILLEILLYYFSLSFLSYICEMTGTNTMADSFRSFACVIRILMLICVFQMFILIISTGLMLTLKSGG